MTKKTITLSIDSKIYEEFQQICDKEGMSYSKKIQTLVEKFIKTKR